MRLNLKATDITIAAQTRLYLDRKLQSLAKLVNLDDPAVIVDVELGRTTRHHQTGNVFFAEINIHRGKEAFRAVADRPDLMSAIDAMRDAIARELASRKDKKTSLLRRSGQLAKMLLRGGWQGIRRVRIPGVRLPRVRGWKWWRRSR